MPVPLAPEPGALLVEALLAQPTLAALVGDRIYTDMPEYQTWPMCVVHVVDYAEDQSYYWSARLQIDCWGQGLTPADELETSVIARTIQSVSRDVRGAWSTGHICNSYTATIVESPDNGWARHVIDLLIEFYALP